MLTNDGAELPQIAQCGDVSRRVAQASHREFLQRWFARIHIRRHVSQKLPFGKHADELVFPSRCGIGQANQGQYGGGRTSKAPRHGIRSVQPSISNLRGRLRDNRISCGYNNLVRCFCWSDSSEYSRGDCCLRPIWTSWWCWNITFGVYWFPVAETGAVAKQSLFVRASRRNSLSGRSSL
jgi:hypothetical protein